ncbi:hypothetical protein F2P81_002994 [Scophthalmus maximus]|uniref:Uncharacterized protein n=1 Tax=Scophthalmus maximus TaxID=52904 RepID=A0A6A4T8F2_SCOMX|nr:hypothetical protein F2P81_002994 [Scophthalmus maximus]
MMKTYEEEDLCGHDKAHKLVNQADVKHCVYVTALFRQCLDDEIQTRDTKPGSRKGAKRCTAPTKAVCQRTAEWKGKEHKTINCSLPRLRRRRIMGSWIVEKERHSLIPSLAGGGFGVITPVKATFDTAVEPKGICTTSQ